ncbi:class I SAM-dependent DNA methyltransferase [Phaeodactylibacter xiamenensis]|uniref:class I SAM-dependent DNA methyltransferase n=1 Tax=Phaeodactylibacter xiamenensis TaxID=1524460 RepID=UPI003BAAEF59
MEKNANIRALAAKTRSVYEQHGLQYDAERSRLLFEKKWLRRFENLLPASAAILDVGCGGGEPIGRYFIEQGYAVTGIDFAAPMVELAKARFPDSTWYRMDMRVLDLQESFQGIISWHSFFHLTPTEQRATLARFAQHLQPKGLLLLTVGPDAGEVTGHVGGQPVYHSSLSPAAYQEVLHSLGMTVLDFVPEDPECDFASVLLSRKMASL